MIRARMGRVSLEITPESEGIRVSIVAGRRTLLEVSSRTIDDNVLLSPVTRNAIDIARIISVLEANGVAGYSVVWSGEDNWSISIQGKASLEISCLACSLGYGYTITVTTDANSLHWITTALGTTYSTIHYNANTSTASIVIDASPDEVAKIAVTILKRLETSETRRQLPRETAIALALAHYAGLKVPGSLLKSANATAPDLWNQGSLQQLIKYLAERGELSASDDIYVNGTRLSTILRVTPLANANIIYYKTAATLYRLGLAAPEDASSLLLIRIIEGSQWEALSASWWKRARRVVRESAIATILLTSQSVDKTVESILARVGNLDYDTLSMIIKYAPLSVAAALLLKSGKTVLEYGNHIDEAIFTSTMRGARAVRIIPYCRDEYCKSTKVYAVMLPGAVYLVIADDVKSAIDLVYREANRIALETLA